MGLLANLPALEAKDVLDEAMLGKISLNASGWRRYTLDYTGDKELAERAADAYIEHELAAGRKPE